MQPLVKPFAETKKGTWLEIRADRLIHNLNTLRQITPHQPEVLAVVKANAYGHGLTEIAKTLDSRVAYFGVASVREALELKDHQIKSPVFIFGRLAHEEIPLVLAEGITLTVSSLEEARDIADMSLSLSRKTSVHIKVDTGMGRFGISYDKAEKEILKIAELNGLTLDGIYTHFPSAEHDALFTTEQQMKFERLIETLKKQNIHFRYHHATNSAGTLNYTDHSFNLIRPGLSLYGIYPDSLFESKTRLAPVLSLKSAVSFTKRIQAGDTVSYGRTFRAQSATTIGILPIGYSHGYPFRASGKAKVLYRGKYFDVAGRVCMDYICVDFKDTPIRVGDEVTLIGEENNQSITVEELALWAGTIPYEIITGLASYVPRFFRFTEDRPL